jgi:sec-independent protein translocase protein TatB
VGGSEVVVLLAVAAVVLGPERLPQYAQQLARLVRELRRMAVGVTEQAKAELGDDFDLDELRRLDPRQYDPRRIIREALTDVIDPDDPFGVNGATAAINGTLGAASSGNGTATNGTAGARPHGARPAPVEPGTPPPFDPDAT